MGTNDYQPLSLCWESGEGIGEMVDWITEQERAEQKKAARQAVKKCFDVADYDPVAHISELKQALRSCACPYPILDDYTIGACIDAGKCSCVHLKQLTEKGANETT